MIIEVNFKISYMYCYIIHIKIIITTNLFIYIYVIMRVDLNETNKTPLKMIEERCIYSLFINHQDKKTIY